MSVNPTDRELLKSISDRYSPYRFADREVETDALARCLEAAGWASSSFNEQPWRFIVATRRDPDAFATMLGCLLEANQGWASKADVLVLTAFRKSFTRNENPNRVALHDLGQAAAHFTLQAVALGLGVHQMAGVNLSQIRNEYQIPDEFEPATAMAIGYPATDPPSNEHEMEMAKREANARKRRPLAKNVFSGSWGNAALWVQ